MSNFLEQLKKAKFETRFNQKRKSEIRADLLHHIEAYELVSNHDMTRQISQRSIIHRIFFNMPVITGVMLVAILGGGVSFAAEKSLPGDALYSVKVGVNEKVETALAFSPVAKAKVEQSLAVRRITEAETLATQGRLNDQTKDNLDGEFHAHAEAAAAQSAEIKTTGDVGTAASLDSDFESVLEAHATIIARLHGVSFATAQAITPIAERVQIALGKAHADRVGAENKVISQNDISQTQVVAQMKINAAANSIAEVDHFIAAKHTQLGADATLNAKAELNAANTTLGQAQTQLTTGAFADAFRLAGTALRTAQEAKTLTQANAEFGTDLRVSIGDNNNENGGGIAATTLANGTGTVAGAGILRGTVFIGPLCPGPVSMVPVNLNLNHSNCLPNAQTYAAHKIFVYAASNRELIQTISVDANGHYEINLPTGDYTIDFAHDNTMFSKDLPRDIHIDAGVAVSFDIHLDTGMR